MVFGTLGWSCIPTFVTLEETVRFTLQEYLDTYIIPIFKPEIYHPSQDEREGGF